MEIEEIVTSVGTAKVVNTKLTFEDKLGALKARFGINRYNYTVEPGLYAVGTPDEKSQVLVTANYKLTFDALRSSLEGLSLWILVIDTKGINVWCAAGKGTFGNYEILKVINKVKLKEIISHNTIILPQLGAPGVAAPVLARAGFRVVYGPVRAVDIRKFLNSGLVEDEEMSQVQFNLRDRIVLTPMEFIPGLKYTLPFLIPILIFNLFLSNNWGTAITIAMANFLPLLAALVIGTILVPVLLPYIPFRAFSLKGLFLSMLWSVVFYNISDIFLVPGNILVKAAFILFMLFISSYTALQFTGSSTYTSLSGTTKETIYSIIIGGAACITGLILLIIYVVMR